MAKQLEPPSVDNDRDLEPQFCVVYVVDNPVGGLRAARTHARTMETIDEVMTFLVDMGIDEEHLVNVYPLAQPLTLSQETEEVPEVRLKKTWTTGD